MATSGTYTFNPSVGEIMLSAFARCGIRRAEILTEHLVNARNETNFMLSEWSNRQVNLWTVDLVEQVLTASDGTYDVDPSTIMILDAYISTSVGGATQDRVISPVSRTEYASFPNKESEGYPSVFWFDRLVSPTITLWKVPDDSQTYTLKYYRCRQVQDAGLTSGQTAEIPYRWIDAFVAGLTARLAQIYKPEIVDAYEARAERAWAMAATQDVENVRLNIVPMLGVYRN